jgi:hypothetical protein
MLADDGRLVLMDFGAGRELSNVSAIAPGRIRGGLRRLEPAGVVCGMGGHSVLKEPSMLRESVVVRRPRVTITQA